MRLHTLPQLKSANKPSRRIGRGKSSTKGKTAGVGIKGQKVRTRLGRNRLQRFLRLPFLRGKRTRRIEQSVRPQTVKLAQCNIFDAETLITPEILQSRGLILSLDLPVKILASGALDKGLQFSSTMLFSSNAVEKIKRSGGKIIAQ